MKPRHVFFCALALLANAACSELPEEPQVLSIAPGPAARELGVGTEHRLTAHLGGRAVRPVWTTSDPAIARSDASGVLRLSSSYAAFRWVQPGECAVDVVARVEGITSTQRTTVLPLVERTAPAIYLEKGDGVRLKPPF